MATFTTTSPGDSSLDQWETVRPSQVKSPLVDGHQQEPGPDYSSLTTKHRTSNLR